MKNIVVVIVTYNGMPWIKETITSLLSSSYIVSIVVVDNNSDDHTVAFLKETFPEIHLIKSETNVGFGKGNNIGLRYVLNLDFDFVFLLNQDAIIEEDTITKLVKVAELRPDFGILSPIHLNWEGTNLEYYFSQFVNQDNSPFFYSDFVLQKKRQQIYETNFVNAAAWLIPKKVLFDVGGFDPMFCHYGEDDNYCQRIIYHGYKIGVVPGSYIKHDSRVRQFPANYFYSNKYFYNYKNSLQVKFGNINVALNKKTLLKEKKKVLSILFENLINFKYYPLKKYCRHYRLVSDTFQEIGESRKINRSKNPHYLS